jgi:hypothetical protein
MIKPRPLLKSLQLIFFFPYNYLYKNDRLYMSLIQEGTKILESVRP